MVRFLLFTLLCVLTILLLRMFRSPRRRGSVAGGSTRKDTHPAASADEIVDVTYRECGPGDGKSQEGS